MHYEFYLWLTKVSYSLCFYFQPDLIKFLLKCQIHRWSRSKQHRSDWSGHTLTPTTRLHLWRTLSLLMTSHEEKRGNLLPMPMWRAVWSQIWTRLPLTDSLFKLRTRMDMDSHLKRGSFSPRKASSHHVSTPLLHTLYVRMIVMFADAQYYIFHETECLTFLLFVSNYFKIYWCTPSCFSVQILFIANEFY